MEKLYPYKDETILLRSCEKEILTPLSGTVRGNIPEWIDGALIRNGSGSMKVGETEYKHIFDGDALLHRFAISKGEVTYQCKFLESEIYKKNKAAQRIVISGFATKAVPDPCHSLFWRLSTLFKPRKEEISDNCNVSVYPFGDEIYTLTESTLMHRIDPQTLDEKGLVNTGDLLVANHTAHPHVLENGDVYNLGISRSGRTSYNIIHFPNNKTGNMFENASIVAKVPARWKMNPGYMHSFGITENYFIIVEQPWVLSLFTYIKNHLRDEPKGESLKWYPNYETFFHVVRRSDGVVLQKFSSKTFFYFHTINQYEKDGHIVFDICCYKDGTILDVMYTEFIKNIQSDPSFALKTKSQPKRFVLPLHGDTVTLEDTAATASRPKKGGLVEVVPETLCHLSLEMPRINYGKYNGRPYRYFYSVANDAEIEYPYMLVKLDTVTKTWVSWKEKNCSCSEPVFVPKPDSTNEDDGVILSALIWAWDRSHEVSLLVLDAKTFTELGRVTFQTPSPVPGTFHGWFVQSVNSASI